MTAYVVYGLSLAKDAGYSIDEGKIKSAISWLRQNYNQQKNFSTKTYMAFAVTTAGEDCKDWLLELYKDKNRLNSYSIAILAISLHNTGLEEEAMVLAEILEKRAIVSDTTACWSGKTKSYGWTENKVEKTSYCLKALLTVKPESALISKIVTFLVISRKGPSWYSTKDTAAVIMALSDFFIISKELNPDFTADVFFNGTKIKSLTFTKEDVGKPGQKIEIPFDQGILSGKNTIKFEMNGKGMLYYAAYLKYFTVEENVKATDSGFKINKTYYLITPEEEDEEKAKQKLGSSGEIRVKSQDIILVELDITGGDNYEYLIIEDPKPAGCEFDTEQRGNVYDWNYWYTHEEMRDEKIAFFSTYYWAGNQKITYRLRAETPGTFHVMPARAYLMYSTEIGGNSDEIILTVKEDRSKKDLVTSKPVPVTEEEIKAETEKKAESIEESNESKEEQNNNFPYYLWGIGGIVGVFLYIFYIRSKRKS